MSTVLLHEHGDGKIQGWHRDRLAAVYVRQSSRQQILDGVWGYTFDPRPNLVDVYVGYLRRKLATNGHSPIETVRGMGYRLLRGRAA